MAARARPAGRANVGACDSPLGWLAAASRPYYLNLGRLARMAGPTKYAVHASSACLTMRDPLVAPEQSSAVLRSYKLPTGTTYTKGG
jgi:hypothetical protein